MTCSYARVICDAVLVTDCRCPESGARFTASSDGSPSTAAGPLDPHGELGWEPRRKPRRKPGRPQFAFPHSSGHVAPIGHGSATSAPLPAVRIRPRPTSDEPHPQSHGRIARQTGSECQPNLT